MFEAVENNYSDIVNLLLSISTIDINLPLKIEESNPEKNTIIPSLRLIRDLYNNKPIEIDKTIKNSLYTIKSPLHLAVSNQNMIIISNLLKNKNIDIDVKNEEGKKPIELTNNQDIIDLFHKMANDKKQLI